MEQEGKVEKEFHHDNNNENLNEVRLVGESEEPKVKKQRTSEKEDVVTKSEAIRKHEKHKTKSGTGDINSQIVDVDLPESVTQDHSNTSASNEVETEGNQNDNINKENDSKQNKVNGNTNINNEDDAIDDDVAIDDYNKGDNESNGRNIPRVKNKAPAPVSIIADEIIFESKPPIILSKSNGKPGDNSTKPPISLPVQTNSKSKSDSKKEPKPPLTLPSKFSRNSNYNSNNKNNNQIDVISDGDEENEMVIPPTATTILKITDLKRPFTLDDFLAMLREIVFIEKDQYWINSNRSIAYIQYKSLIDSVKAYRALQGKNWPQPQNRLKVSYEKTIVKESPPPIDPQDTLPKLARTSNKYTLKSPDTLFRKTIAVPPIYYVPNEVPNIQITPSPPETPPPQNTKKHH